MFWDGHHQNDLLYAGFRPPWRIRSAKCACVRAREHRANWEIMWKYKRTWTHAMERLLCMRSNDGVHTELEKLLLYTPHNRPSFTQRNPHPPFTHTYHHHRHNDVRWRSLSLSPSWLDSTRLSFYSLVENVHTLCVDVLYTYHSIFEQKNFDSLGKLGT